MITADPQLLRPKDARDQVPGSGAWADGLDVAAVRAAHTRTSQSGHGVASPPCRAGSIAAMTSAI
jgi:hypothetical protein